LGIEPATITGVLRLVVAQRLVRRLCPACRRQDGGGGWSAPGCEACLSTGYRGRLPVAEFLTIDPRVRQAVARRADLSELQAVAREAGMVTMAARGRRLAAEGLTSAAELARVLSGVGE
jgi:general secretion pathway protein E